MSVSVASHFTKFLMLRPELRPGVAVFQAAAGVRDRRNTVPAEPDRIVRAVQITDGGH